MAGRGQRAKRAGLGGLVGAGIAGATVWLNLRLGVGGDFLGRGTEITPTLPVTEAQMILDSFGAALVLVPPLAVMAAFSGPWPFRILAAAMMALGWHWLGDATTFPYQADFGMTWLPGEGFWEVFWRPVLTPMLWALAVGGFVAVLAWVNRAPKVTAPDLNQGPRPKNGR